MGTNVNKIHILWATPRSTSTAFEWMMRMRGDMVCFHEPFGEAWYMGEDARAPRNKPDSPRKPGLSFQSVLNKLLQAAEHHPVFSKDMPQFTEHLWSAEFLGLFQHSFLIRDPAKVLSSLKRSYDKTGEHEGFTATEIGFKQQRLLFDLLDESSHDTPVVIDSDDLLADPKRMVKQYCHAMGFDYIEEALSWTPGDRREVLWYDSDDSIWHETLRNSDGLKAQPPKCVDPQDLPPEMLDLYHKFMPHYRHLQRHRLDYL